MTKILAIDLGHRKSVTCVHQKGSKRYRYQTVETTTAALHDLIVTENPGRVVIEICPDAGWIRDLCETLEVELHVANTAHEAWRWKNVKRKTDRDDARKLVELSALGHLPLVHVPRSEVRAWRELINYRQALVARRTRLRNSIRADLRRHRLHLPAGAAGWSQEQMKVLDELAFANGGTASWQRILQWEIEQLLHLQDLIHDVESDLDELARADHRVAQLQTIPGVGPRLAELFVSMIDDPRRFRTGKQLASYVGLVPRQYQSGSTDRQGRISRQGNPKLRAMLIEVSWMAIRYNPKLRRIYHQMLRDTKTRKKIAIVAVARRLAVVCWAMLRDGTTWKPPGESKLQVAA